MNIITELSQFGVKYQEIATLAGVTTRSVQNWQSGKHSIPKGIHAELEALLRERKASIVDEITSQIKDVRRQLSAIERNLALLKTAVFDT